MEKTNGGNLIQIKNLVATVNLNNGDLSADTASEVLRSATDALRRLLARRSAEAVLKP